MPLFHKKFLVIAIDGGAASGKSSTSKILAERLNLLHVDTGAHYRAITYTLLCDEIKPENHTAILNKLSHCKLATYLTGRSAQMTIDGKIPDDSHLRSPLVNQFVSQFAAIPEVREFLLQYQRSQKDFAVHQHFVGLIMEGRDIGSVVLPDANFRFFLEADPQTRINRRALQGQEDSIHTRDNVDLTRKTAPMICPPGAIRIDSSHLTLEEVVEQIFKIVTNT